MKKSILFAFAGLLLSGLAAGAGAAEGFDAELSVMRKDIITMCAELQAGKPAESPEQLLKEIDSIAAGWRALEAKYASEPPAVYAKDPAWKAYFSEAADNFAIMRAKAAAGDYKRAMQFCGMNCALFVKMHQVNGIVTLTDKMFAIRQGLKSAQAMAMAGNRRGAARQVDAAVKGAAELEEVAAPEGADAKVWAADVSAVKTAMAVLEGDFKAEESGKFDEGLKKFFAIFNKIYQERV